MDGFPKNAGFFPPLFLHVLCLGRSGLMRVWIRHMPRKIQIRAAKATRSLPFANAIEMSLSKFFKPQPAVVELPCGATLEG